MDKYAVFGNPIEHSLSPLIHDLFAKQTHQNMSYTKQLAPLDGFADTIKHFRDTGGKGASITLPFKEQAFKLADETSETAFAAKAANTYLFREDGSIFADNTDGAGLVQDLTHNHHYSARQKKILILGAGGAARGILYPLLCLAPAKLTIANRTAQKAVGLAKTLEHHGPIQAIALDQLGKEPFDLIINATSVSLSAKALDLPSSLITPTTWCYDLVYAKKPTAFLEWGKQNGAEKCLDGLGMLVEQGAAAFYLWRGIYPDTQSVLKAINSQL